MWQDLSKVLIMCLGRLVARTEMGISACFLIGKLEEKPSASVRGISQKQKWDLQARKVMALSFSL